MSQKLVAGLQDKAEKLPVSQTEEIKIKGETYTVTVDVKFPTPDLQGLDFGVVKVLFTLANWITRFTSNINSQRRQLATRENATQEKKQFINVHKCMYVIRKEGNGCEGTSESYAQ